MTTIVTEKRKLYLDLDGVMSDFEGHYLQLFGHVHSTVKDGLMWKNIHSCTNWWIDMPKLKTHDVLWEAIKEFNPTILTGCPPSKFNHASQGKREWCKNHFGEEVEVITCLSRDKFKHMANKGDILIDDMEKNCNKWQEYGGLAILFDPDHIDLIIDEVRQLMME